MSVSHTEEAGLRCPKCEGKTSVVDSRPTCKIEVRRRRVCRSCCYRFTTYESERPLTTADRRVIERQLEKFEQMLRGTVEQLEKRNDNIQRVPERVTEKEHYSERSVHVQPSVREAD